MSQDSMQSPIAAHSDRWGAVYAGAAPLVFALSFADLFEDKQVSEGITVRYTSLWGELSDGGHGGAGLGLLGVLILIAVVGLCLSLALRPARSALRPVLVAGLCVPAFLLLATKAGTGSTDPELSDGGSMLLGASLFAFCYALAHAIVRIMHRAPDPVPEHRISAPRNS